VRAYRDLLAHRDARWPLLTSMVARLTPGMMILALVLLLRESGYGYTAAGLVSAGHQLGVGVASPLQGRLVDRLGPVRILIPDAVGLPRRDRRAGPGGGRGAVVPAWWRPRS
jgi:MFS family permease